MATRIWGSSGSTWTTTGNWVGGVVPVATDSAVLNSGSTDVDGIDQATINLGSLAIGTDYTGAVGTTGAYLIISADAVAIKSPSGAGDIYLDSGGTAAHDEIIIDSLATGQNIYLKASTTCPRLVIRRGNVTLVSGTFTDVYTQFYGNGVAPTVSVAGATITNLRQMSTATTTTSAVGTITNAYIDAGTMTINSSDKLNNLYQRGGTVEDLSTSTCDLIEVVDGTFTAARNFSTKTYSAVRSFGEASVDLDNGISTFTITSILSYGSRNPKT